LRGEKHRRALTEGDRNRQRLAGVASEPSMLPMFFFTETFLSWTMTR
jgi:hypothetical protein